MHPLLSLSNALTHDHTCTDLQADTHSEGDVRLCDCVVSGGADGSAVIVDASTGTKLMLSPLLL